MSPPTKRKVELVLDDGQDYDEAYESWRLSEIRREKRLREERAEGAKTMFEFFRRFYVMLYHLAQQCEGVDRV
ncbi:unnamed protein product [Linum tenue]|uniref:Uncharacterized protein n=1 Tax=Linum tenue TaxID=586396 RepID=A0AAV0I6X3_9ROSI|nr:unnamed protein product [Linum tenue]